MASVEAEANNGHHGMKAAALLFCSLAQTTAVSAAEGVPPLPGSFRIGPHEIVRISPGNVIDRKQFDEDWGQFEVRVPKSRFSVPAPNCRKNVILRMPGVPPDAPGREQQLEWRWRLFQALHAAAQGEGPPVEVEIARGPYMSLKPGGPVLQYCNAYIAGTWRSGE